MFLPAVRPLLTLAASMEEQRNHVMPPPKTEVGDELDLEPLPPKEKDRTGCRSGRRWRPTPGSPTCCTAGRRTPARAPGPTVVVAPEDEEFLGIPGLLTPAQTAELLSKRDDELRVRIAASHRADGDDFMLVEDHPDVETPAARGATPPSCAGRSTGWSTGSRRGPRSRTR